MFVIYEISTTHLIQKSTFDRTHKTERAAKCARTRYLKANPEVDGESLAITKEDNFFNNIERQVERTNLMSGKTYMEPINTPSFMSPSCESYWSM